MNANAKQKLADEVTSAVQQIAESFAVATDHLEAHPDHGKAERLGQAAWGLCEELRAILLRSEPADEWAPFLALIADLKDTSREWIDFAREQQAAESSQA